MKKILTVIVAAGIFGFFVGSVLENEMVYTMSGCVAVWAGLILAIQTNRKAEAQKRKVSVE